MKKQKPLMLPTEPVKNLLFNSDEHYPVFHFSIEGNLPSSGIDRKYYVEARDYFLNQVMESYNWDYIDTQFEHAVIYTAHYFKSPRIRDLDNLNRKPLIDAVKRTLLFTDDNFHHLSYMEEGYFDGGRNHIEVFVMSRVHLWEFIKYLDQKDQGFIHDGTGLK
ncbi:hypothetical protein [Lentibacillus salinarum]|uniref:Uncharacterized protein n=1 Tax=Lentibacillus salinarum TaxID=446820 RepID=A0ABW3ZXY6_9BACI